MPFLIATKVKSGTQALITGNATNQQRYTNLKSTFTPDGLYRIFAEPAESQREVSWYTDWEVDESQPILTLGQLETMDPGRAMEVRERVASIMDLFFNRIKAFEHNPSHYQRLRQVLQDSFEIPQAQDNVWLLTDTSGQERLVLTQWGHLEDTFNPERGIINRWPRHRLRDVSLQLRYRHSQATAGGAVLYLSKAIESGEGVRILADEVGRGILSGVLPGSEWEYYQVNEQGEAINQGVLVIDERDVYEIELDQWGRLFCVVERGGVALSGEVLAVEVGGLRQEVETDADGHFELPHSVRAGSKVQLYQSGVLVKEFDYDPTHPLMRVELAATLLAKPVVVVLLERSGKPVANGLVQIVVSGQAREYRLNSEGETKLEQVGAGQEVVVHYLSEQKKRIWQGKFQRKAELDRYVLVMKRRWRWLWLLGLLLLLLGLLCIFRLLPICPYCCGENLIHINGRTLHQGDITLTLEWETADDLDLGLRMPNGQVVYYGEKTYGGINSMLGRMSANLEIDANVNATDLMNHPIEHIYCYNPDPGRYQVIAVYYNRRTGTREPLPFTVKIQVGDSTSTFTGNRSTFPAIQKEVIIKEFSYP